MARRQIVQNDFSGGVSDYVRQQIGNVFSISKHFDIFSNPNRLAPYKGTEVPYASQSTAQHQTFVYYNSNLYALGVISGTGKAHIDYYNPVDNPTVSSPTNGEDSAGSTGFVFFVQYKGILYGTSAGTRIWSYNIGTTTFTSSARAIVAGSMGIVHSKSDTMYFATGTNTNVVASLNQTTWTDAALTLPTDYTITSFCEYGNYLAIGCKPASGSAKSKVFLWDMVSSDVSEVLDFSGGDLYAIETLGNTLIGVLKYESSNTTFPSKMIFKRYDGSVVRTWKVINTGVPFFVGQQKENDRFYFGVTATSIGGSSNDLTGVWAIGFNKDGELAVTLDHIPNSTANVANTLKGFFVVKDYVYISYIDQSSSNYAITKSNDQSTYDATSPIETQKYTGGDSTTLKKIVGIAVSTEPIPSGGSYSVYYKADSETSYTLIATNNTLNSLGKEHINIESTQKNLPEAKEIQFQITSTGGTVITGWKCVYDDKKTLLQLK